MKSIVQLLTVSLEIELPFLQDNQEGSVAFVKETGARYEWVDDRWSLITLGGGGPGPVGPQGPQGPKGDKGDKGDKGNTGADGADSTVPGPQGPIGATGAAGAQGAKGDKGDAGPQGLNGADSTVPGPPGSTGAEGIGIPVGGTPGQVLSKIDGTDFNSEWVDPTGGGGGIPEPTVDGTWSRKKAGGTYTWEAASGSGGITVISITWDNLISTSTPTHKTGQAYKVTDKYIADTSIKNYEVILKAKSADGSFFFDYLDNNGIAVTHKTV